MRTLLLLGVILLTARLLCHAQLPPHLYLENEEYITYVDVGAGTYGVELGISGYQANDWVVGFFSRYYPGPGGPLYNMDSPFIFGGKAKYYGIMSEGFFAGPLGAIHIFSSYRPVVGAIWGYDFYQKWSDKSEYKNFRIGFEFQAGFDTEGEGFIGVGFHIGIGHMMSVW